MLNVIRTAIPSHDLALGGIANQLQTMPVFIAGNFSVQRI